jgi:hypothetical protein
VRAVLCKHGWRNHGRFRPELGACFCSLNHKEGSALTHLASTLPQSESPWPATVLRCCIPTHSVLVTPADSTAYWWGTLPTKLWCAGLCVRVKYRSVRNVPRLWKERVKQAANPCVCSQSRVPPPPSRRVLSIHLSRMHIHTASVIADPCKLYTVVVWLCRGQQKALPLVCHTWEMGICMGCTRPSGEGHGARKPSN